MTTMACQIRGKTSLNKYSHVLKRHEKQDAFTGPSKKNPTEHSKNHSEIPCFKRSVFSFTKRSYPYSLSRLGPSPHLPTRLFEKSFAEALVTGHAEAAEARRLVALAALAPPGGHAPEACSWGGWG